MFRLVYISTIENELGSFQLKLSFYFKQCSTAHGFSISDTDKCSFCKMKLETLLHLFYECRFSFVLFGMMQRTGYLQKLRISLGFRPSEILFGAERESNHAKQIYTILFKGLARGGAGGPALPPPPPELKCYQ